jgi:serine/threonine-protein kinase RsbW
MTAMGNAWDGEATAENLARVREFVDGACRAAGADPQVCFDLKLAVDEACTNIIVHGYAGGPPGKMRVSFESDGERLRVVIADWGRAFDPAAIAPPDLGGGPEERASGGLGWHLIRSVVDEISYEADAAQGNRLILVKQAHGSGD